MTSPRTAWVGVDTGSFQSCCPDIRDNGSQTRGANVVYGDLNGVTNEFWAAFSCTWRAGHTGRISPGPCPLVSSPRSQRRSFCPSFKRGLGHQGSAAGSGRPELFDGGVLGHQENDA